MMRNSVFIALFIMNCAYQIWIVSGQNCTASGQQPPYSNACIYNCIEDLYDKKFCNVCSKNADPLKLKKNDTLATLLPYILVRYNETIEAIVSLPSCSGCVSETNSTEEHIFIEYVQPMELYEFYDLSFNSTVKSHRIKVDNTIVESVHELYTNLTNRFDESKKWCVNALGIEEQYNKFKIGIENTADIDFETTLSNINSETTTVAVPTNENVKTFVNETDQHPTQSNVSSSTTMDNAMKNDNDESLTTTETPEQITTIRVQNDTSKMRNMIDQMPDISELNKNSTIIMTMQKPQLHDHHYHHSVTIITAVSLILLTVLIASVAIIGLYINRHKDMGAHLTSSRTYVFDHQN